MNNHKTTLLLTLLACSILAGGSAISMFLTKKIFLEDFNHMNGFYKQTLFLTGQSKREEAIQQYDLLTGAYAEFAQKYQTYRPYVLKGDKQFSTDISTAQEIISSTKTGVYTGDLPATHIQLEAIRPIFQEMFKRNNFSLLSMALVDFHDKMEEIIAAADAQNTAQLLSVYPTVNESLQLVEKEDSSPEIAAIRKNLDELKALAESNQVDQLPAKAAELKSSFIKVYLKKG